MREIKFKAKRIDNGERVIGCLLIDDITGQYFIHASGNSVNESDKVNEEGCLKILAFEVDPSTICQYTGLKDKNGKEIYENDIVQTRRYGVDDGKGHNYSGFDKFMVAWENSGFCLKNKWRRFNLHQSQSNEIEVIGNVFDNPELLEVTE